MEGRSWGDANDADPQPSRPTSNKSQTKRWSVGAPRSNDRQPLLDRDRELGCSKPLPVILKPVPDEQLSSWLSRHAAFYGMPPIEFFRRLTENSSIPNIRAVDKGLTDADATKLGRFLHCDQSQI